MYLNDINDKMGWLWIIAVVTSGIILIACVVSDITSKYRWKRVHYTVSQVVMVDGNEIKYSSSRYEWICLDTDGIIVDNSLCEGYLK